MNFQLRLGLRRYLTEAGTEGRKAIMARTNLGPLVIDMLRYGNYQIEACITALFNPYKPLVHLAVFDREAVQLISGVPLD